MEKRRVFGYLTNGCVSQEHADYLKTGTLSHVASHHITEFIICGTYQVLNKWMGKLGVE